MEEQKEPNLNTIGINEINQMIAEERVKNKSPRAAYRLKEGTKIIASNREYVVAASGEYNRTSPPRPYRGKSDRRAVLKARRAERSAA